MTTTDPNARPILCTLAKHHKGDHDPGPGRRAHHPCGFVIRYEPAPPQGHLPGCVPPADPGEATDFLAWKCVVGCFGYVPTDSEEAGKMTESLPNIPPGAALFDHADDDWRDGIDTTEGARIDGRIGAPASPPAPSDVQRVAEAATAEAMRATIPVEPSIADLIAACQAEHERHLDAIAAVAASRAVLGVAEAKEAEAAGSVARARSALAIRIGKRPVFVGDVLCSAVPPRKPKGGELAEGALWRLEPVEVAK